MPLDRLVLIIVSVFVAAALTIYVGVLLSASAAMPSLFIALVPILGLVAYVAVRIIRDRLNNDEDDHYDDIER